MLQRQGLLRSFLFEIFTATLSTMYSLYRLRGAGFVCKLKKLTLNEKKFIKKMYNSVIECVKVSKYVDWVKKDLIWACLKGVTL